MPLCSVPPSTRAKSTNTETYLKVNDILYNKLSTKRKCTIQSLSQTGSHFGSKCQLILQLFHPDICFPFAHPEY